jgi:hypothetical protein
MVVAVVRVEAVNRLSWVFDEKGGWWGVAAFGYYTYSCRKASAAPLQDVRVTWRDT